MMYTARIAGNANRRLALSWLTPPFRALEDKIKTIRLTAQSLGPGLCNVRWVPIRDKSSSWQQATWILVQWVGRPGKKCRSADEIHAEGASVAELKGRAWWESAYSLPLTLSELQCLLYVMVASFHLLSYHARLSYQITALVLSLSFIYGCGLVSS